MIARSHTRSGEPVHFGNDVRAHAGPGEHLPELRHRVGEPVEHAVPPLQALDPRGRHLDAADRRTGRTASQRERRACATRRATCPTSWRRSSTSTGADLSRDASTATPVEPLEGQSLLPVFAHDTTASDRKPMFWEHEGNAAVRIGKWKLVQQLPARVGALRHGRRPHRAARPRRAAIRERVQDDGARSTTRGRRAAACIPREKIVALMKSQGVTRAFWEKDEV